MNRNLKKIIYSICPSDELKASLGLNDLEGAVNILQETFTRIDTIPSEYTIFDALYASIEKNDPKEVLEMIILCEKLFFLDVASKVIELLDMLASDDKEIVAEHSGELFWGLKLLHEFPRVKDIDYEDFLRRLIKCKNKNYPQVDALDRVLTMPICGNEIDKTLANYIATLIHGNEITFYDVMLAILDDDPDTLMEKVEVMRYLRCFYYDLTAVAAERMKRRADALLAPGLERKKDF